MSYNCVVVASFCLVPLICSQHYIHKYNHILHLCLHDKGDHLRTFVHTLMIIITMGRLPSAVCMCELLDVL